MALCQGRRRKGCPACCRLERRWHPTDAEVDQSKYRRACRIVNQLINASRSTHYHQQIQDAGCDHKLRWKIVNKLLHSHNTDKTRTDDENRVLCTTFATYFTDKIARLRDSVSDTLLLLLLLLLL